MSQKDIIENMVNLIDENAQKLPDGAYKELMDNLKLLHDSDSKKTFESPERAINTPAVHRRRMRRVKVRMCHDRPKKLLLRETEHCAMGSLDWSTG